MTAEIAIINKSAVALAADSAVTISTGTKQEKIFNTEDKLFELCRSVPIGIMIYNGMSFCSAPIQVLIRRFRSEHDNFGTVEEAASRFLEYLLEFGLSSPRAALEENIKGIVYPVFVKVHEKIKDQMEREFTKRLKEAATSGSNFHASDATKVMADIYDEVIDDYAKTLSSLKDATSLGGPIKLNAETKKLIADLGSAAIPGIPPAQSDKLLNIGELVLTKEIMSDGITGIVVAGYGRNELFPTLISYEIDGIIGRSLKFSRNNFIDIDRDSSRTADDSIKRKATVIPFAQKEMVERFLYGLDERMQSEISKFCESTIPSIGNKLLEKLQFSTESERGEIRSILNGAQEAFLDGLRRDGFGTLRNRSRAQIEDMVEFMPKPELAEMAEALVNLTSIKRRVSRGMETVGGPIDVAIISQSEGFVWIKRKHYFPADRNPRYFERVASKFREQEARDAEIEQSRRNGKARRRSSKRSSAADRKRSDGGSGPNQRGDQ